MRRKTDKEIKKENAALLALKFPSLFAPPKAAWRL